MKIKRDDVLELVKALPAEVEVDELIYRLYLLKKLDASEAAIAEGRVIPVEEVRKMVAEWRK